MGSRTVLAHTSPSPPHPLKAWAVHTLRSLQQESLRQGVTGASSQPLLILHGQRNRGNSWLQTLLNNPVLYSPCRSTGPLALGRTGPLPCQL